MTRRSILPGLPWLLPLLLALGVAGMHTLGHLASHHGVVAAQGSHAHAAPAQAVGEVLGQAPAQASGQAVGQAAGQAFGMNAGHDRDAVSICSQDAAGFDPSDVCLAVLTSVIALLIAVVWAAMLRWRAGMGGWASRARTAARAPPRRLTPSPAVLSVMRI
ncbi:hypothetical protein [Nonomuraea sp. NPDC005650]|uniref:hypothetical protein n=1 Tax=Nonomuraea sp. NPDC005650 TaxID=3157045 RepID=UPI0033B27D80